MVAPSDDTSPVTADAIPPAGGGIAAPLGPFLPADITASVAASTEAGPTESDVTAPPDVGASGSFDTAPTPDAVPPTVDTVPPTPDAAAPTPDAGLGAAGETVALASDVTPRTGRRAQRRRVHRRIWWGVSTAFAVALVAAGWMGAQRINRPLAQPSLLAGLPSRIAVPGAAPPLPWPSQGQGAVSVPALGYAQQSGSETAVPIASLTKMTNALVILHDHPLAAGANGPSVTMTAADVAEYDVELHLDQSTVAIRTGEILTERQMLEALLTQSANDIAYSLALWDAGSLPAFVAKMNTMAASLGATSSHYVDASGFDPQSVSTAADCLRIAAAAMNDPTFAEVVAMKSVTLPLVGTLPNIVTEIGSNGVIGIKSGYTSAAGGCMVLASNRVIEGRTVLVLAAVLGQPTPPPTVPTTTTTTTTSTAATVPPTGASVPPTTTTSTTSTTIPTDDLNVPDPFRYTRPVIEALLNSATAAVVKAPVAAGGTMVGTVDTGWGGTRHHAEVVVAQDAWLVGWPSQQVSATTSLEHVRPGGTRGSVVGTAHYRLGSQSASVPLKLAGTVPEPSWWWRLLHG